MAKRGVVIKNEPRERDTRPIRWRKYPHLFLIVCEDGNVEPYYFETFKKHIPEDTIFLKAVGTGKSSKGVVEQAIVERKKLSEESKKEVDEVWAVFDKDDADLVPANTLRFEEAFEIAKKESIRLGYSNEVFELWLLLHLTAIDPKEPLPRKKIYEILEAKIKNHPAYVEYVYVHGKTDVIDACIKVGNEPKAIERASELLAFHKAQNNIPINANPSTTVFVLVKRLRELIEFYSNPS